MSGLNLIASHTLLMIENAELECWNSGMLGLILRVPRQIFDRSVRLMSFKFYRINPFRSRFNCLQGYADRMIQLPMASIRLMRLFSV